MDKIQVCDLYVKASSSEKSIPCCPLTSKSTVVQNCFIFVFGYFPPDSDVYLFLWCLWIVFKVGCFLNIKSAGFASKYFPEKMLVFVWISSNGSFLINPVIHTQTVALYLKHKTFNLWILLKFLPKLKMNLGYLKKEWCMNWPQVLEDLGLFIWICNHILHQNILKD